MVAVIWGRRRPQGHVSRAFEAEIVLMQGAQFGITHFSITCSVLLDALIAVCGDTVTACGGPRSVAEAAFQPGCAGQARRDRDGREQHDGGGLSQVFKAVR